MGGEQALPTSNLAEYNILRVLYKGVLYAPSDPTLEPEGMLLSVIVIQIV